MKIHRGHSVEGLNNPALTIGMFDGVHLGHRSLLDAVIESARRLRGESVVITFEPHPRILLSSDSSGLRFLTSLDEKISLLGDYGIDHLYVLPFTKELSRLSACQFVENILVKEFNTRHLVVGFDHRFGRQGEGSGESVGECASKFGFSLERVGAFVKDKLTVSSTIIRNLITEGELSEANKLLGYDYFLKGTVIDGKRIGRSMGYPTANLKPDYSHKLIPSPGVYAVEVEFEGRIYKAMLYIGRRPTIEGDKGDISIEANLFDFEGDMYGKEISIYFRHRLRGDIKFENREILRKQIDKDKEDTIRLLT